VFFGGTLWPDAFAAGKKSARPPLIEDERQIPCYHLSLPAPHDARLFKYGGLLRDTPPR